MIETVNQAFRELLRHGISANSLPDVWKAICEEDNVFTYLSACRYTSCGGGIEKWLQICEVLRKNRPEGSKDVNWLSEGF